MAGVKPINGKNNLLHFKVQQGNLPRRSGFLVKPPFPFSPWLTYFGPGHRPNMIFAPYYVPTDWPAAGALLKPPRVVWLNSYFKEALDPARAVFNSGWWYANFVDPGQPSTNPLCTIKLTFIDGGPGSQQEYVSPPHLSSTVNADLAERNRLVDIFAQVKDKVESIQKGKTWVQVIDWDSTAVFSDPHYTSDGFFQIAAPPGSTTPDIFYGTDFFHIWAGHALNAFGFDIYTPSENPDDDPVIANPKGRLVAAYNGFRGHATQMFHPALSWGPPTDVPDRTRGPRTVQEGSYVALDPSESYTAAPGLVPYNPWFLTEPPIAVNSGQTYDLLASNLSDFQFSHPGSTSLLTVDYVVAAIAKRFNFDPDTGHDLPPQ